MNTDYKRIFGWGFVALVLAFGLILSTVIAANGFVKARGNNSGNENIISVTGSAKKQIKSDLIVWKSSFSVKAPALTTAYADLNSSRVKVRDYLISQGVKENEIIFSSINIAPTYKVEQIRNEYGQLQSMTTNEIDFYTFDQTAEISSKEVEKITDVSRKSTELLSQGIIFASNPPQYFYTKISDLKVDMIAEATKDAKSRADNIAINSGSKCGKLRSAALGIFQITPINSNEVSDSGMNDTSSLDKEIMSVVRCRFEIK